MHCGCSCLGHCPSGRGNGILEDHSPIRAHAIIIMECCATVPSSRDRASPVCNHALRALGESSWESYQSAHVIEVMVDQGGHTRCRDEPASVHQHLQVLRQLMLPT